jgi:plasmid stabilization system protein ParE
VSAILFVTSRADRQIENLSERDAPRVLKILDFLCDHPLGAPTAQLPGLPGIRRAVAGMYLIYYEYEAARQEIIVHAIRHGRQKPLAAKCFRQKE